MSNKSETLRLADRLCRIMPQFITSADLDEAAAELRRLSAVEAQRDALLEALRRHVELHDGDCICEDCAALTAVEENT